MAEWRRKVATKRPLTQKQIWAIRFHLDRAGRVRAKALFDRELSVCDLNKIKDWEWGVGGDMRPRSIVFQQKASWQVQVELTADMCGSLSSWREQSGGQ